MREVLASDDLAASGRTLLVRIKQYILNEFEIDRLLTAISILRLVEQIAFGLNALNVVLNDVDAGDADLILQVLGLEDCSCLINGTIASADCLR